MIDTQSSTPMYEQVSDILKKEILLRKYGDKGCIGTHSDLANRFGVSLITIRKAIQILSDQNIVIVKQGKGTFVKNTVLQDGLTALTGVSNILSQLNMHIDVQVKDMKYIITPDNFSTEVKKSMGSECVYIERLHLIDGVVVGFARLYLPYKFGQKFSREDVERFTIYQLYENKIKISLGRGVQYISAGKANQELAEILQVERNYPVLQIERESYSAQGDIIEVMELFYEYSQYTFKVELNLRA